jgi:hypothetical protein
VSSLTDRDSYRFAVFAESSASIEGDDDCPEDDFLLNARRRFDAHVAALVEDLAASDALAQLSRIVDGSLDLMRPMLVELGRDEPLPALFQHYQEQSLLGVAALLPGVPGLPFRAIDLVRNYIMAEHVELELDQQEEVYRRLWLAGLEKRAPADGHESALDRFLTAVGFPPWPPAAAAQVDSPCGRRFVSEFETRVRKIRQRMLIMAEEDLSMEEDDEDSPRPDLVEKRQIDFSGIELYARFDSYIKEQEGNVANNREHGDVGCDSAQAFLEAFASFLTECQ